MLCTACPFECEVDRSIERGKCRASDRIEVSIARLHHWEEPPISGSQGSGTVFFSHCNLRCRFCQNYEISQLGRGREVTDEQLLGMMYRLQDQGAHNINLVSPTQYTDQLVPILERAELHVPVVWNSNGYEKVDRVRRLEGLVQVFLPDLKYHSDELARRCSGAPAYFSHASAAVAEMKRQTGTNRYRDDGTILAGVIVRHLVLPGQVEDSIRVLDWIAKELGNDTSVSLMAQYYPCHRARELDGMNRRLTAAEYERVRKSFLKLGFEEGHTQDLSSAKKDYTPDFEQPAS
ncbi:MAG: radical SAM protein [candidate division WOR-3 bacterium]|nr:MAG: radical SAM protein [candidate division WOR-3 bacterium]